MNPIFLAITLATSVIGGIDEELHLCSNNTCQDTRISCLSSEPCTIFCDTMDSCANSIVDCGVSTDCTIECNYFDSCRNATIIGKKSNYLHLYIYSPWSAKGSSVENAKIFCPYSNITTPNATCFIECAWNANKTNDGYGAWSESCNNMSIYAVEGSYVMYIS